MIDSIHEKLLSYALGEGAPEWRQEVESLLLNDALHQQVWEQLLHARRAMEMSGASEPTETPRNLSQRTVLLVEYSKRMNPPAPTPRGKRDFLQNVFAPHNVPLPGGVPLRGTAWKDATPQESSSGSARPTPRSRHEKVAPPRSLPNTPKRRVVQTAKRPASRAATIPTSGNIRALDVAVLSGLFMFWAPLIVLAVALNHHDHQIGPDGGSLYQFSQEIFGGVETTSYRTSSLPKIEVQLIPPIGSYDKKNRMNRVNGSEASSVVWSQESKPKMIAPLYAAEGYPAPIPSSPLIRPVSYNSFSRSTPLVFSGSNDSSLGRGGNRSPYAGESRRPPLSHQLRYVDFLPR
jgi:hypothetical protein